uniref:Major facilitator superfamily (MFS) profile domain-containing protein n=1 Tax=Ciona savignyi TaxID=51511 RepID=H2YQL7_CIOSA
MVTTKTYRNEFIAVIAIYANLVLVGIDNILLYSDKVFIEAGLAPDQATFATIGVFTLQLLSSAVGSKLVDRFGGFKVHVTANVMIIIAHVTYTVSQVVTPIAPTAMPYIAIFAVGLFLVAWSGGTNLASFALLGEITREPTRATAYGFAAVFFWAIAWVVGFVPPYLQIYLGAYALTIWLGCAVLFLIYVIVVIPRILRTRHLEDENQISTEMKSLNEKA